MSDQGDKTQEFVLLGKITKPHGIRGEVKMYPYSSQPESFLNYREIYVDSGVDGTRIQFTVERARVQGKTVILKMAGCEDRNQSEALVNREVWLEYGDLPELKDDEYYWADLDGKMVRTDDGIELGRVTGILDTGAHGILSVTGQGHEYLIPIREEFIIRVDDQEVVLKLPPGLLEMNKS